MGCSFHVRASIFVWSGGAAFPASQPLGSEISLDLVFSSALSPWGNMRGAFFPGELRSPRSPWVSFYKTAVLVCEKVL